MILIADSSEFLIETKVDNLRETVFEIGPNSCNNIPKKVFAGDEVNHAAYFVLSTIIAGMNEEKIRWVKKVCLNNINLIDDFTFDTPSGKIATAMLL